MPDVQVLKHLTVKRPVEASRMDFFNHAEAFAALVNLEFVSTSGEYYIIKLHGMVYVAVKASTECHLHWTKLQGLSQLSLLFCANQKIGVLQLLCWGRQWNYVFHRFHTYLVEFLEGYWHN